VLYRHAHSTSVPLRCNPAISDILSCVYCPFWVLSIVGGIAINTLINCPPPPTLPTYGTHAVVVISTKACQARHQAKCPCVYRWNGFTLLAGGKLERLRLDSSHFTFTILLIFVRIWTGLKLVKLNFEGPHGHIIVIGLNYIPLNDAGLLCGSITGSCTWSRRLCFCVSLNFKEQ
jgi:hypothetical protein